MSGYVYRLNQETPEVTAARMLRTLGNAEEVVIAARRTIQSALRDDDLEARDHYLRVVELVGDKKQAPTNTYSLKK